MTKDTNFPLKNPTRLSVVGLGYVGLPVAIAFSKKFPVIAFDINANRIKDLKQGYDLNNEVSADELKSVSKNLHLTHDPQALNAADFHIIAVPSPINSAKQPDFKHLISASQLVGKHLKKNDIVVFESTVYPGATEEMCIPVLEAASGLKSKRDFFVGYSPERINPGDKERSFTSIKKIVSAQTPESLKVVANTYASVVVAGVHPVTSIAVAEAAKVIENTQRDLNIALMNELALIFNSLGLDTQEVLNAAQTKWNFLPFQPGLVGGHCIGVDPYYLTHKAIESGIHPEVILAGRRINDGMGKYIATHTVKQLNRLGKKIKHARVAILGITFKENISDIRNSRVIDIINELQSYDVNVIVHDPIAHQSVVKQEYNLELADWNDLESLDAIVLAVAHDDYKKMQSNEFSSKLNDPKLLIDVKSTLCSNTLAKEKITHWRL